MKDAFFAGVIVKPLCPFVSQSIARAISCGSNDALDVSSSFDGVMKMKNRHILPLPEGRGFTRKCISVLSYIYRAAVIGAR